jgi:hypothetical protein
MKKSKRRGKLASHIGLDFNWDPDYLWGGSRKFESQEAALRDERSHSGRATKWLQKSVRSTCHAKE